ncbi:MAG: hypothetical protein DME13_28295 [Candidatus Rokuibacteriota bacterium]|nr:MAG: hypothetical protein DME13_28295 [Candidatus Rokubacteria bacterium]
MRYDAAQINRFDLTRYPDYRGDFPPDVYQLHRFGHLEEYEAEWGRRWGANGIGRLRDVALSRPTGKKGDRIFYYDSGDERAVVGIVKAVSDAYPDPEDPSGKYVAVDVAPVKRLPRPVTLAEVKADPGFKDFPLVRIGRLSVMPVTDAEWARIERMSGKAPRGEP